MRTWSDIDCWEGLGFNEKDSEALRNESICELMESPETTAVALSMTPRATRRLLALVELYSRLLTRKRLHGANMASPRAVFEAFRGEGMLPVERFWSLALDAKGQLLSSVKVSSGSVSRLAVSPTDIFRPAVACRAGVVILVHNHPSGDPTPSQTDLALTDRLVEVGKLLRIPVLDHIIIGDGHYCSFAELGHI